MEQDKSLSKNKVSDIWRRYEEGIQYKQSLDLFYIIARNNDFVSGNQWKGVAAPNLDKPVFNVIAPAINYYMAILISDAIAVDFGAKALWDPVVGPVQTDTSYPPDMVAQILQASTLRVFDLGRLMFNARQFLRNCAVDGDACLYLWYNDAKKSIDIEVINSLNVSFGNTSTTDVESQPYIIIASRKLVSDVKREAKDNGVKNWDDIQADYADDTFQNQEYSDAVHDYVTVLLYLWRDPKTGKIWSKKTTQKVEVQEEQNLGFSRYPVVWQSWVRRPNSYHGISPVSDLIPNQIFINKAYALSMRYVINFTHSKIFYDQSRLPEGWNNDVNSAIAVEGDPNTAIFAAFKPPDLGDSGTHLADNVRQHTENSLGATKSALGQERPYNTSAIMAQQRASSMPLDYQRFDFHDSIEALVRCAIDMMQAYYGTRYVQLDNGFEGWFDYKQIKYFDVNLNVDVGAGSYWSEANALQVLRDMLEFGLIVDPTVYIEALPQGYFKDKAKALESIRNMQGQSMENPNAPGAVPQEGGGEPTPEAMGQDMVARLAQMPPEEAMAALSESGLPQKTQEQLALALEQVWGGQPNG